MGPLIFDNNRRLITLTLITLGDQNCWSHVHVPAIFENIKAALPIRIILMSNLLNILFFFFSELCSEISSTSCFSIIFTGKSSFPDLMFSSSWWSALNPGFSSPNASTSWRSQFHQQFTSSFCADCHSSKKIQTQTVRTEKLRKTLSYYKAACKILLKLTPGQPCY